jgi:DNA-binding SARP family transcriptional activator
MEFRILGPLQVSAGDGALKVGGPKQRAVLAHLILRANRPVSVDLLIDGLWGEEPPETAKNTLQTHVYRLRQLLGEDRIASANGGPAVGRSIIRHGAAGRCGRAGLRG